MQITLLAATSLDGFIADDMGNGNFSSREDKAHLRFFLRSNECDCFICGRKTAEEFQDRLTFKPLLVLTHFPKPPQKNIIYFNDTNKLENLLNQTGLNAPVLLGGAETYTYFLEKSHIDRVILTVENFRFYRGKNLDFSRFQQNFILEKTKRLSEQTSVYYYQKRRF